ncbi:hypothetical protein LX16_2835 [Stackebrandtia albiflava]|uniref:Uncharacterized protein n=1 Tax=Stackebrandtia albiflava TaxID=406432 RepID=A0A562V2Q3_9ACTN|nr:hypothetical protein [Stackebrandtia albiflava]TWJ12087.1 hypothetical protein LX16_2835 [Stackebrandtia albiflava]
MTDTEMGRFSLGGGVFVVASSAAPHTVRLYSVQGGHRILACTVSVVEGSVAASWGAAWLGQPADWYAHVEAAAVEVYRAAAPHWSASEAGP